MITSHGRAAAARWFAIGPHPFCRLGVIVALGCNSGDVSLDCTESLTSYCSTHGCATSVDPQNVVSSFCVNQTFGGVYFGVTGPCPSNGEIAIDVRKSDTVGDQFYYDSTGKLEAVIETTFDGGAATFSCIAGPKPYTVPHLCLSDAVGHACIGDAGSD